MAKRKPPDVLEAGGPFAGRRVPLDVKASPLNWQRFPIEALPAACRKLVTEAAAARGVDNAFVGVLMLPVLAGAIGNTRVLRLKAAYVEPAVLWGGIVQRSGSIKSAGLDDVLGPHRERNRRLLQETRRAFDDYEHDLARYRKAKGDSSLRPARPRQQVVLVDDVTAEALIARLADNPRGLLLAVDELAGWVTSFDQYKQARGSDVNKFLTMHRAGELRSDRKSGEDPTIYVPRGALSVVGTIQPKILARVMGRDYIENGLLARLFVAMPPTPIAHWSDDDVSPVTYGNWQHVVDQLLELECNDEPRELQLSADAWPIWRKFHDLMIDRGAVEDDQLSASYSKLRGGAARIALVLALAHAAEEGRAADLVVVDQRAMEAGIKLAKWFAHEAERVYAVLAESPEDRERRALVDAIHLRGGRMTPYEVSHAGPRCYRGQVEAAELALQRLVSMGAGSWVDGRPGPRGGRPSRTFVLAPALFDGALETSRIGPTSRVSNATPGIDGHEGEDAAPPEDDDPPAPEPPGPEGGCCA